MDNGVYVFEDMEEFVKAMMKLQEEYLKNKE